MDAHIKVKNFGPIEKAEIDLRPLTVFVGESNTGKTYLAALIYAVHQHFGGISQFSWANYFPFLFGIVRSMQDPNFPSRQDAAEYLMFEVLKKLNMAERPFKFSDLPYEVHTRSEHKQKDLRDF